MTFSKIFASTAMFCLAIALSCTDHTNPDPGGQTCTRVNGSPRLYPCEFEIVQIDFMRQSSNDASFATLAPSNHDVVLPRSLAFSYQPMSGQSAEILYKIRLHIKRVANPAFPAPQGYWISDSRPLGGTADDESLLAPNIYYPAPTLNMAVGQTIQVFSRMWISIGPSLPTRASLMTSIQNPATFAALKAAPNNYTLVRDLSEAYYLPYNVTYEPEL
ncbi:hypothetical protein [Dyadobacter sp. OTU695]|uniref:hypothetical protein n=1 Tax=Dyadobacter sp. OTU695 TaxID=3043860 RepID=UPI00313D7A0A